MGAPFLLSEINDDELIRFLDRIGSANPSVLGYHYPAYRRMLETIEVGNPMYIAARDEQGDLCAVLPGFLKTQDAGSVYSSLPFFGPNAGVLLDRKSANADLLRESILQFLLSELDQINMISASFYSNFLDNHDWAIYKKLIPEHLVIDKFTSYIPLDGYTLNNSLEYDIRKALKSGITIREGRSAGDAQQLFDIYKKNCLDYDIPIKPEKCIAELVEQSQQSSTTKTYIAELNGTMIGGLIMIYAPKTASYYLPCSIHEYRSYQPMTLLIRHAMNEAVKSGIDYWNWESSPSTGSGVYKFKKKWGSLDGNYKIIVKAYKDTSFYKSLGQKEISKLFPYFFVYPFHLLSE